MSDLAQPLPWRLLPFIAAFSLGCLGALAMEPTSWWFVLFPALGGFYYLFSRTKTKRSAFALSWLFAFGYFLCGLSWIGNALLVEGNHYAWAYPLAVAGIPFLLAFFWGVAGIVARAISPNSPTLEWGGFVIIFSGFEWLRGHLFTGFPWNLFGTTWVDLLPVIQITAHSDIYFLSLLTIIWATCVPAWWINKDRAFMWVIPALSLFLFAANYAYGNWRIEGYKQSPHDLNIQIVQPNIAQKDKWERNRLYDNVIQHINLSYASAPAPDAKTLVIWPETALIEWLYQDPFVKQEIQKALQSYPAGATLITGMLRTVPDGGGYHNAIVQINDQTEIENSYNKSHLVPFGEYIPFQNYIPLPAVTNFQGLKAGAGPASLAVGDLSYAPAICYEIIFPHSITPADDPVPDFILTVTNDAWYGQSAGPYQHLTQAVFRAVEYGIPVLRAANTGISAIIAPTGAILKSAPLMSTASFSAHLPQKIERTARSNNLFTWIFAFFHLGAISLIYATKRRAKATVHTS